MFINCRHCDALVATNPATDEPPERCPRCGGALREPVAPAVGTVAPAGDTASGDAGTGAAVGEPAIAEPEAASTGDDPVAALLRDGPLAAALSERDARRAEELAASQLADDVPADAPAIDQAGPSASAEDAPSAGAGTRDDTTPAPAVAVADAVAHEAGAAEANAAAVTGQEDPQVPEADRAPSTAAIAPRSPSKPAPSFVATRQQAPATATRVRWVAPVAIAVLSLLLLLQIVLADRARLSADARWRPLLSGLCGVVRCSLPAWREPTAFRLVARDVRAHPQQPGVLRATATFRNDARWAQAWPRVVLTLSDVEGRAIGRRDFAPTEYLGATPTENSLSSGQSAMILLDVVEPAANVVAFSFEFH